MITRLKVDGFKNLVNVDLKFDTFVCISGSNAVGKSNLFDAIRFLSQLAEHKIMDAAKSVRSESQKASDLRDIFFKINDQYAEKITFLVEMIIPPFAFDESGEKAAASITTVKYELELGYLDEDDEERIVVLKEALDLITQSEAKSNILFESNPKWKKSVIKGRRISEFISTDTRSGDNKTIIRLHQDQTKGKPFDRIATQLPRTVLSTASAEYPTACVVKQEMKSWMFLQLEPSAMRKSDDFDKRKTATLGFDGSNLPSTIYRLHMENPQLDIYQKLANRLSELVDNVERVSIDRDEKRALLTLLLKFKGGAELPARSLSDGTLRFLALSILELDRQSGGIICLEEPENGIHPTKIRSMIQLLQDIACDTEREVDIDNPFRQVIINTHSQLVVKQVDDDSLLVASIREQYLEKFASKAKTAVFSPLEDTWRTRKGETRTASKAQLMAYLGGIEAFSEMQSSTKHKRRKRRVMDNPSLQGFLFPAA